MQKKKPGEISFFFFFRDALAKYILKCLGNLKIQFVDNANA
jgi:hypothetical protein